MKLSNGSYRIMFVLLGIFLGMGFVGTGIIERMVEIFTNGSTHAISYWFLLAMGIIGILLSFKIPPR